MLISDYLLMALSFLSGVVLSIALGAYLHGRREKKLLNGGGNTQFKWRLEAQAKSKIADYQSQCLLDPKVRSEPKLILIRTGESFDTIEEAVEAARRGWYGK